MIRVSYIYFMENPHNFRIRISSKTRPYLGPCLQINSVAYHNMQARQLTQCAEYSKIYISKLFTISANSQYINRSPSNLTHTFFCKNNPSVKIQRKNYRFS